MTYPIEKKLVIAVASSALFDLAESDRVFREKGQEVYRKYQRDHQRHVLDKGVAFPFIRRFLTINTLFPEKEPVEVVLLSKNDPDTGSRVLHSIQAHGLHIIRACFMGGKAPFEFIPSFNASLFLSADSEDVKRAIHAGFPAGTVLKTEVIDDPADKELRVAFDFDGVIADDEAEIVYRDSENLKDYHDSEKRHAHDPLNPGPLNDFFVKLAGLQRLEQELLLENPGYQRIIRTAIVTARSAPSHERFVETLRRWGVSADETFFLGGIEKRRVLEKLKPHIYFDDQMTHLKSAAGTIPSVHVPFGVANS
jgi:5'-nucleotidase